LYTQCIGLAAESPMNKPTIANICLYFSSDNFDIYSNDLSIFSLLGAGYTFYANGYTWISGWI